MSFYVYIIYSVKTDRFYKGQTSNIENRMTRHDRGHEKSTSMGRPWRLLWCTEKPSRSEAIKLELKLKNLNRRRLIEFMLKFRLDLVDGAEDMVTKFEP